MSLLSMINSSRRVLWHSWLCPYRVSARLCGASFTRGSLWPERLQLNTPSRLAAPVRTKGRADTIVNDSDETSSLSLHIPVLWVDNVPRCMPITLLLTAQVNQPDMCLSRLRCLFCDLCEATD